MGCIGISSGRSRWCPTRRGRRSRGGGGIRTARWWRGFGLVAGYAGNVCLAQSHGQQLGLVATGGGGGDTSNWFSSNPWTLGVSVFNSDAADLNALEGEGNAVGGSGVPVKAPLVGVGGDYMWGTDSCGRELHGASGGVALGPVPEVHRYQTHTRVWNWWG